MYMISGITWLDPYQSPAFKRTRLPMPMPWYCMNAASHERTPAPQRRTIEGDFQHSWYKAHDQHVLCVEKSNGMTQALKDSWYKISCRLSLICPMKTMKCCLSWRLAPIMYLEDNENCAWQGKQWITDHYLQKRREGNESMPCPRKILRQNERESPKKYILPNTRYRFLPMQTAHSNKMKYRKSSTKRRQESRDSQKEGTPSPMTQNNRRYAIKTRYAMQTSMTLCRDMCSCVGSTLVYPFFCAFDNFVRIMASRVSFVRSFRIMYREDVDYRIWRVERLARRM